MSKILFVMTGADHWTLTDGTKHPTGYWAEEAATPYRALHAAGHQIVVATPGGVVPPVDPASLGPDANGGAEGARDIADTLAGMTALDHPLAIADVDLDDYDAVLYPGGHGPMEDLARDADSGRLLTRALASGKPLAVVCHGPAALLAAVDPATGRNAFAGRRVAAFTDAEETLAGFADRAPWLLQTRLAEAGLTVDPTAPWTPHVVVDGNLITGQNPASSAPLAQELLKQLG
ncbi:type 1 glutamine amidotransferase domain-containing protein [Kitasatospora sp. NA04385]|uniref:type 1 glutamine amidotransferase domain-containing protein n=1 Tax=Kitasatospora sp. NA04385 TaxID=2742135 RepID=UPI001591E48D|nr:type 1 glutamine amidotransferase domain-containing protein [Kitasatospora sp. NA04385]QKW22243.1 type 1 glutamine amidotransferase domain-containing protein [Kitasatospora sp. NA04385]